MPRTYEQYGFNESEKRAAYERQGGCCACCGRAKRRSSMQAHHNHYRPSRPTYVCRPCHLHCVHKGSFNKGLGGSVPRRCSLYD